MTLVARGPLRRRTLTAAEETALLIGALGVAVALRPLSTVAFVAALGLAAARSGWRPAPPTGRATKRALGWGLVGGAVLVAGPALRAGSPVPGRGAAGFAPWGLAVALVVCAEEAFLRGALWQACQRWGGGAAALVVTTGGFALIHVPLYGWGALPLDTAVGLALGGLRMASGSVAAPAVAHLVADWAGWWLG